jgi:hypothetical protein
MPRDRLGPKLTVVSLSSYTTRSLPTDGQVAQLVERGPEKAGVGGSIPSLATKSHDNLALKKPVEISRANNTEHWFASGP